MVRFRVRGEQYITSMRVLSKVEVKVCVCVLGGVTVSSCWWTRKSVNEVLMMR